MKTSEEYLDEVHFHKQIRNTLSKILSPDGINGNMYKRLLKAFNLIEKDAYNQAIEDAYNNVEIYIPDEACFDNYVNPDKIEIDSNSILKLKIK